ncbi:hypothetical protein RJ639_045828 [Escallonia herrerae]|uniref:tRNA/rRNA methyltransferase SpoU type domain-containing protein n=1 Tax=Escallonia herrerae TaxID=1293975 RepID=A0AA88WF16_9ASTE|nr:hypothetical protein RJ639_045828 [Escallonia herrerae]
MECANAAWVSTFQLPLTKPTNSRTKQSIVRSSTKPLLKAPNTCADEEEGDTNSSLPLPYHVKCITSTSNPFVKHCLKLRHSPSYRHSHGSVLVVGSTPIREIYRFQESVQANSSALDCLLVLDKAEVPEEFDNYPVRVVRASSPVMKKLSGVQSTESINTIALMRIPPTFLVIDDNQQEEDCRRWFPSPHRVLVLDGIQDPGNLGTLIRSALAFKWGGVFLLPGCCDPFNEKALRASRGASFQLPVVSGSWNHLEALVKNFQMKILAGHLESNKELKPVGRLEGSGLSKKTKLLCELVSIPMAGEFESLNVSVADGIFLYMLQPRIERLT